MRGSGRGSRRTVKKSPRRRHRSLEERICDLDLLKEALSRAVLEALRRHKRAGNPVPEWRDGKVHWIRPEDIPDWG